jgi:hypothetical protein
MTEPPRPEHGAPAAATPADAATASNRTDAFRPATGEALVALLETGITGLGALGQLDGGAPPAPDGDLGDAPDGDGPAGTPDLIVPIESLLYRDRAALDRARAVRDVLRAQPGPPDPALLDELYDLLDLAAS